MVDLWCQSGERCRSPAWWVPARRLHHALAGQPSAWSPSSLRHAVASRCARARCVPDGKELRPLMWCSMFRCWAWRR